jgi:hypothetical protein
VLKTLLDKLEKIRKELNSDKVFDVVGRLFEGVSLKEYLESAVTEDATEQVCRRIEGILTPEQIKALEAKQRTIYGDGGDVRRELDRLRADSERETYRRLLPGFVRHYVERAAPLVGMEIEGDLDRHFTFAARKRGALDALWPVLETHPPEERNRLTVYRPDGDSDGLWLHPGEPVFESFRAVVTGRLAPEALEGAVFVDAAASRPYFFHLLRVSVIRKADPAFSAFRREEIVEERLVALRQSETGEVEECPVERLLLLKGNRQAASQFGSLIATAKERAEAARDWARGNLAKKWAERHRAGLAEALPAQLHFLSRGFDYQESDLAAQRARFNDKARAGDAKAKGDLTRVKDRQRLLTHLRDQAIRERRREPELIATGEVEFLAHALVVPSADPEDQKRQDAAIELLAMQVAQAYEEVQDAVVFDVHTPEMARRAGLQDFPGFDLLSRRPNREERSIEVKGRAGIGDIEISENEWARACNLRHRYWLYVVFDCGSAHPRLLRVQDPFGKLLAKNRGGVLIDEKSVFAVAEA